MWSRGLVVWALAACSAASDAGDTPPVDTDADTGTDTFPDGAWVLDGATLVDADGPRLGAVLIREGTIVGVRDAGGPWPEAAVVVDATGRWVTPGLVDAHVHLNFAGSIGVVGDTLASNLAGQLYWGVTQVVDLGGPEVFFALRGHIEAGDLVAPHILATGPMLTAVGSHPCETAPDPDMCVFVDGSDAEAAANALVSAGADGIKVAVADADFTPWGTPRIDVAAIAAAVGTGVPVYAHVDEDDDVIDAVDAGVTFLAHPPFAAEIGPEALAATAHARAVFTTVSAFDAVNRLLDGDLDPDDPSLLLTEATRADWRAVRDGDTELLPGWAVLSAAWTDNARANLGAMDSAGTRLIPGSDAGYYFVPHGRGLHEELAELVALGWTPLAALTAATLDAREVLELPGGRIEEGAPADLLILTGDPVQDVAALGEIEAIVLAGTVHDRESLRTVVTGAFDDVCVTDDCDTGRCDGVTHTCGASCETTYALDTPECEAQTWCMPADGYSASGGVCHPELPCDLYAQDCAPAYYGQACLPFDSETNACWLAGPRTEGQTCSWTDENTACQPGLYCSLLNYRCYELCDPEAADTCAAGTRCTRQYADTGVPWFGVCL